MRLGLFTLAVAALLSGCLGASAPPSVEPASKDAMDHMHAAAREVSLDFAGELTGTPLAPALAQHVFDVPPGTVEIKVQLDWALALADLNFSLVDPNGEEAGVGFKEAATRRAVATVEPPAAGEWTLFVGSKQAVREKYKANVTLTDEVPGFLNITQVMKAPVRGFAELNLIMEANATFDYAWLIQEAGNPTYFNIHSHQDGKTVRHVETTAEEGEGNFTAPSREVYSLLWRNSAVTPINVDVSVEGYFRVHSETHHT